MKLLFCNKCHDVVKLRKRTDPTNVADTGIHCECGLSYGWYEEDGLHAVYGGSSNVIGLSNTGLVRSLRAAKLRETVKPTLDLNKAYTTFEAWVIAHDSDRIRRDSIEDGEPSTG